jgi:hypothetical protein
MLRWVILKSKESKCDFIFNAEILSDIAAYEEQLEITQREEKGLPDLKQFESKILSQEEIFFGNKLS